VTKYYICFPTTCGNEHLKSIFLYFVAMKFTAEQIAGILEGEVIGNPNAEVHVLSKIEEGKVL
jgi:hypothetical protein